MVLPVPATEPFPHLVLDDFWLQSQLDSVLAEIPDEDHPSWKRFGGEREEGKLEGSDQSMWGEMTRGFLTLLSSRPWCSALSEAFVIPDLTPDTTGGGYHQIVTGGRLAMHVDFNRGVGDLYRRLNCLVYLNKGWRPEWGGALLLGKDCEVTVAPQMNRTVIFATSDRSWHGHPTPWAGPEPRRSVAVYYYSPEPAPEAAGDHSTVWLGA
jgi:hypothetical protein